MTFFLSLCWRSSSTLKLLENFNWYFFSVCWRSSATLELLKLELGLRPQRLSLFVLAFFFDTRATGHIQWLSLSVLASFLELLRLELGLWPHNNFSFFLCVGVLPQHLGYCYRNFNLDCGHIRPFSLFMLAFFLEFLSK
ncbi:hypothetical protein SCLCIDRAFT_32362 [Scleroderma citrinum Foug A]|uniref:Uncharacterized protein n=1 Tax=Scleroderma citrinum Foug A TaxID=1036808 RepID=A0A0C3D8W3_9AGAM|nr:hypothetical protein SCLCIDRAFT_32362 [Scleroderma citrinum Foug A]